MDAIAGTIQGGTVNACRSKRRIRKTIADIVDCCVEGNTNSCTLEVEVRENVSLVIDMKFEVKEKKVDELQS